MKTIFEHIDNLVTYKQDYTMSAGEAFSPYLIQRWISMISPNICNFINETSNSQFNSILESQEFHDYILSTIPKLKKTKIKYIKKSKDIKDYEDLKSHASYLKMSIAELKELLKIDPDFIEDQKDVEIRKKRK